MPGVSASDANLEAAFANLAFARLKDKAPSLLDYLLGFQLIDKNEDQTHAVAVFGFKIGKEYVYAPVFYINGELKGHELLYVKSQDAFVPMTEQWVNYILNRRPKVLGESEHTPRNRLGIRQPDFDIFARAPYIGSKMASADNSHSFNRIYERMKDDYRPAMELFTVGPLHSKFAGLQERFTLEGALKALDKQAAINLLETMKRDTKFASAVLSFHTMQDLVKAAEDGIKNRSVANELDAKTKEQRKGKYTYPKPRVLTEADDPDTFLDKLTDDDRSKLLRDRYLVIDKREKGQKTRLFRTQLSLSLSSPVKTGFYDVLTPSGEARKMLALTNPIRTGSRRDPMTIVVDLEAKKFGCFNNSEVLTSAWHSKEEVEKAVNALPEGDSLGIGDMGLLIRPDGLSTDVFKVDHKVEMPDGTTEIKVWCRSHPSHMSLMGSRNHHAPLSYDSDESVDTICFTKKEGSSVQNFGRTMFVPKAFKALVIKKGTPEDRKYSGPSNPSSDNLTLGSFNQALMDLQVKQASSKRAGVHTLAMLNDGLHFTPDIDGIRHRPLRKAAAMKFLIEKCGFDEADADLVIAETKPAKRTQYFMKYAFGEPPQSPTFIEPDIHDDPGMRTPMQYPHTTLENLGQTDNSAAHEEYRNDRYVDDAAKQQAQSASQLGQKEVLDTAVISGLVKTMDSDSAVDGYIGDLLLGLDRIGRILFMYYWHNDKFKERYGQQDMTELEDNLRNVFKNLGELTLFLKQKTIEPDQAENSEVKLDEVLA